MDDNEMSNILVGKSEKFVRHNECVGWSFLWIQIKFYCHQEHSWFLSILSIVLSGSELCQLILTIVSRYHFYL